MLKHRILTLIAASIVVLLLSGCFSLAEDVTPPPNYIEPTDVPQRPVVKSTVFPLVPPDPLQGAAIYTEKCLPCHGEKGMGDGPQAANLSNPVAPLGSPDLARQASPVDWYNIVTVGNLERFMPGFSSLSDRQRWDVVAYALTLSTSRSELDEGKEIYQASCVECHGLTGRGDGEKAVEQSVNPASWYDQERLAALSAQDITDVIAGQTAGHPSFADQINESQRYAVAAYVRSLSFTSPGSIEQNATTNDDPGTENQSQEGQAAAAVPETITISGKISNASPGAPVPAGMVVKISAFQDMAPAFEVSGEVAADGTYEIKDVQFNENFVYFAQVDANGLTFNSDILHAGDVVGDTVDLPIEIYETSSSTDNLRTDRLHIFFDFSVPGKIQVVNLYIISNRGDSVVVASEQDGPVIEFVLPEGAENLQFQDGELGGRFIQTSTGFFDRMSILPGEGQHQILYAYELPYDRKIDLNLQVPLPVDSAIVMIPPGGVKLKTSQMEDAGQRDIQGMSYQMYQSNSSLEAGSSLALNLTGRVGSTAAGTGNGTTSHLLIGIGVFGAVLAGAGYWLYRIRSRSNEDEESEEGDMPAVPDTSEGLIEAIVALDDLHASGQLPEEAYQERRADLKARLAEAMKREA